MGFRLVERRPGHAVMDTHVDRELAYPTGVIRGGVIVGLAGSAMAFAIFQLLGEHETGTNIDFSAEFLRPTWKGVLTATADVVRNGKRILLVQCVVRSEEGKEAALVRSKFMRLAIWRRRHGRSISSPPQANRKGLVVNGRLGRPGELWGSLGVACARLSERCCS